MNKNRRNFLKKATIITGFLGLSMPVLGNTVKTDPKKLIKYYSHIKNSKEPLELIIEIAKKRDNIIPPEFLAILIKNESTFNPYAFSSAYAFGISQFIKSAAIDMKLKTHNNQDLINLEQEYHKIRRQIKTVNGKIKNFKIETYKFPIESAFELIELEKNDLDTFNRYDLNGNEHWSTRLDDLRIEELRKEMIDSKKKYEDFKYQEIQLKDLKNVRFKFYGDLTENKKKARKVFNQNKLNLKDDRLIPKKAIPASLDFLVNLYNQVEQEFGFDKGLCLLSTAISYNAGFQPVKDFYGVPLIDESIRYARKIITEYFKIIS